MDEPSDSGFSTGRKRYPTTKITENADPLLRVKKQRTAATNPSAAKKNPRAVVRSSPSTMERAGSAEFVEEENGLERSSPVQESRIESENSEEIDGEEIEDDDVNDVEIVDKPEDDDEAELARLQKKWSSPVYAFFKRTPTIEYDRGFRFHVFECHAKYCKGRGKYQRLVRRNLSTSDATSTSNLRKHAVMCWGKDVVDAACKTNSMHEARNVLDQKKSNLHEESLVFEFGRIGSGKETYSNRPPTTQEIRANHVRWAAESKRPFNLVGDAGYHRLMKNGRPAHYIPSGRTVSRDVQTVFTHCREKMAKLLQDTDGSLNFAIDAWTSPNSRALVAVTVHYEKNGQGSTSLLDIVEVAESHTGAALAAAFTKILQDFGISDKILSITCDNASSNDSMVAYIARTLTKYPGEPARTRCFAHVLNLIAKSMITQFDLPKNRSSALADEFDDLDDLDEIAGDIAREEEQERVHEQRAELKEDNYEGWVNERAIMTTGEMDTLERDVLPARRVLTKLRKVAFAVKNSSTRLLPRWREICREHQLNERIMPRDVKTRWNSTFDMLDFAIRYQKVIDHITGERDANLRAYELQQHEWEIASELRRVLTIFKDGTLFFSREVAPNLAMVIPAMDHIDETLDASVESSGLSQAVIAALSVGKRTLNRYYSKTDLSETYRIAMVLHPRHKLTYFRSVDWPDDWIKTAETMVRTNYELNYKHGGHEHDQGGNHDSDERTAPSESANIFDNLPALTAPTVDTALDEITRYLQTPTEDVRDPLLWWYEHRQSYPGLSRMARDYLSIPATSVNVERVFSGGRMLLSYLRNRLQVQSTRALLCLGEWIKKGLVREKDILIALKGVPECFDDDGNGSDSDGNT